MRLSAIALVLIIFLWSCSAKESQETADTTDQINESALYEEARTSPSDRETVYRIQFKREQSFTSSDEVILGTIGAVQVDRGGRVFMADRDQTTIHVFDPDGSYLTSLGREGKGPMEFSNIASMKIYNDQLYAADVNPIPTRFNVYSLRSLSFTLTIKYHAENLSEYEELEGYTPDRFYPMEDGTFLVGYENKFPPDNPVERFRRYYIQDKKGKVISNQVLEQKYTCLKHSIKRMTYVFCDFPFISGSVIALSDNGEIYSAATEEFLVKVYSRDGEYLRKFEHPVPRKKMNRKEIMENAANDTRREAIANNDLPEFWPALETMFFDDENRLWVSTIVEDYELREWWITRDDGEVIKKFTWPKDKPIEVVKNGFLYARETDEETGIQKIVRYRIHME